MPGTFSSRNTSGGGVSLPGTSSHAPTSSTGGWADSAASTTSSSTVHGDGFTTITNRSSKQAASSSSGFNPNKYKPAPSVASSSRGRGQWAKVPAVCLHLMRDLRRSVADIDYRSRNPRQRRIVTMRARTTSTCPAVTRTKSPSPPHTKH